jgi:hypothetical protein
VIRGYTALIDPKSVGLPLAAMMAITPLDPAHDAAWALSWPA